MQSCYKYFQNTAAATIEISAVEKANSATDQPSNMDVNPMSSNVTPVAMATVTAVQPSNLDDSPMSPNLSTSTVSLSSFFINLSQIIVQNMMLNFFFFLGRHTISTLNQTACKPRITRRA